MKYKLLLEFEDLLEDMTDALVNNDVQRVADITDRQQVCLAKIVKQVNQDPDFKVQAQQRMPHWVRLMGNNQKLLEQAVSVNTHMIHALYGHQASC